MFDKQNYVPVIKWKRGERGALKELDPTILSNITPLFEIQPIPYDHDEKKFKKTIDQYLTSLGEELSVFWKDKRPVFIDGYTLYDDTRISKNILMADGKKPIEYVLENVEKQDIVAIPVTCLNRETEYNESIIKCVKKFNRGVGIRIHLNELADIPLLEKRLIEFITFLDIRKNNIDIFIDLKQLEIKLASSTEVTLNELTLNEFGQKLVDSLISFPFLNEWRSFIFLGTSTLEKHPNIGYFSQYELPRIEWCLYKHLLKSKLSRTPIYGDYNVTGPDWFDFNHKIMDPLVTIRYTLQNKYLIFIGENLKSNLGHDQMFHLCRSLKNHPEYCGRTYSSGDEFIYQCGTGNRLKAGNQELWIKSWVNHHLTMASNSLTNLHVSAMP